MRRHIRSITLSSNAMTIPKEGDEETGITSFRQNRD
jgi:hypothetical protein